MDTATFKMYKFVCEIWGRGQTDWCDDVPVYIDYKEYVRDYANSEMCSEDYDEDWYSLFHTQHNGIDWNKINIKMNMNYNLFGVY